jgi:hypothetical protein
MKDYTPVSPYTDEEKKRASTSDSDTSTLLDEESHSPLSSNTPVRAHRWMWYIDALALFFASILFAVTLFVGPSTEQYVQKYSAYCKPADISSIFQY